MRKTFVILAVALAALAALLLLAGYAYLRQLKFGAAPEGERLLRIQRSSHFAGGQFQNLLSTEVLANRALQPGPARLGRAF